MVNIGHATTFPSCYEFVSEISFILFAYSLPNVPVFLFCQIWEFEYSWFLLSFSWYINFIKIHRIPSLAHSELSTCALLIGNLPPTGCSPAQASSSIWTQHFTSGNHSCKCKFLFFFLETGIAWWLCRLLLTCWEKKGWPPMEAWVHLL